MPTLKRLFLAILLALLLARAASAQVLTTGQTLGKGTKAVLATENYLYQDGVGLNIAYLMYAQGLSKRLDIYGSLGNTTIFGQNQLWVGAGGNLHLMEVKKVDVCFFNIASLPVQHRELASTVLLNSAIVASRPLSAKFSVYSGLNSLFPIGARDRGLFTPRTKKVSVPTGLCYTGKKWSIFAEFDIGKLKAVGFGIGRTI